MLKLPKKFLASSQVSIDWLQYTKVTGPRGTFPNQKVLEWVEGLVSPETAVHTPTRFWLRISKQGRTPHSMLGSGGRICQVIKPFGVGTLTLRP